jgi:HEAT repeat protein
MSRAGAASSALALLLPLGVALAADDLDALKKSLTDKRPTARVKAARDLGKRGRDVDEDAVKALCPLLKDKERTVRLAAATALDMLATTAKRDAVEAAVEPLLDAAGGEDDAATRKTILSAVIALLMPKHANLADKLYPLLGNKEEETVRLAAAALANLGGEPAERAATALKKLLSSNEPAVQARAAASLARASDKADAAEALAKTLSASKVVAVRRACCVALVRYNGDTGKPAIAALVEAMKPGGKSDKASEEVRVLAAEAIARIGAPASRSAIPAIRDALINDKNQQLRHRCIWAGFGVEDLEKAELVGPLTDVMKEAGESKRIMRYDAARVLAFGLKDKAPDRAVELLLQMLADDKLKLTTPSEGASDVRFAAATALAWLGKKAKDDKEVIDALRKAARDKDPALKKEAEKALKDLGVGG